MSDLGPDSIRRTQAAIREALARMDLAWRRGATCRCLNLMYVV